MPSEQWLSLQENLQWLWVLSFPEPQEQIQDLLWSSGGWAAGLDPGGAISHEPISMADVWSCPRRRQACCTRRMRRSHRKEPGEALRSQGGRREPRFKAGLRQLGRESHGPTHPHIWIPAPGWGAPWLLLSWTLRVLPAPH